MPKYSAMARTSTDPFQDLLRTPNPADLGPGPRAGVRTETELNRALDELFRASTLPDEPQQLIRALVLLWHDHMDPAHVISQDIHSASGSFVHGILHRREPDYGNAGYWFRRVGQHPAFPAIASRAATFFESKAEPELQAQILPKGQWNPFGFIDACEKAATQRTSEKANLLREIQRLETEALLEFFLG